MIVFTIFTSLMLCTVLLNAQTTTVCGNIKVIDSCSGTNGTYTAVFAHTFTFGSPYDITEAGRNFLKELDKSWVDLVSTVNAIREKHR